MAGLEDDYLSRFSVPVDDVDHAAEGEPGADGVLGVAVPVDGPVK